MNEMKRIAREFFRENAEANVAVRKAAATRKKLFASMKEAGIDRLGTSTGGVAIEALIDAPTRSVVDVERLAKLVGPDAFLSCVSATSKAVTDTCGKAVLDQVTFQTQGTPNVSVKAKK